MRAMKRPPTTSTLRPRCLCAARNADVLRSSDFFVVYVNMLCLSVSMSIDKASEGRVEGDVRVDDAVLAAKVPIERR
jgi:hypothetical protein